MAWTRERAGYLTFGVGTGALVDGFILHQVLQWHHLVSGVQPADSVVGLEWNTTADGLFHVGAVLVVVAGVVLLWRAALSAEPGWDRYALGGTLIGWGAFHIVDEIVFHLALDLHHIRMVDNYLLYDAAFTAAGVVLAGLGVAVVRSGRRRNGR